MVKVLAIDDDPDILAILEGALELAGHSVVISTDPTRVVDLAVENGVDVVVLDVNMPEASGFDALGELRSHPQTGGLPVLFLSALADSRDRVRGLREGADDYLGKPFEPEEMVLRVERLGAKLHRAGVTQGSDIIELRTALRRDDFASGDIYLGRYRALETLGEGAMGVVLRGWDPRLKRPVALKTLRFETFLGAEESRGALEDLLSEASTLARFNHPNIVSVYDAGDDDGTGFIVMELVDGISLDEHLQAVQRLTVPQLVDLGLAVARALGVAHGNGLVHRDVKPGNILLGRDGVVKVTDFGLAQLVSSLAEGDMIFGTPGFVPPECLAGDRHSPAGDLFSLGAVLYRCATGHSPFEADTVREVLTLTLRRDPDPVQKLRVGMPPALARLISDLLAKDPERRPTADDVESRLGFLASPPITWDLAPLSRPKGRAAVPFLALDPAEGESTAPLGLAPETRRPSSGAGSALLIDTRQLNNPNVGEKKVPR